MNTTITPNGLPALPPASGGKGGNSAQAAATGPATSAAATASSDSVNLTESARSLHNATQAGKGNDMDLKRVEQIRQSLANGSYRIDPGHIADKLMSLESQLTGKP
jgi:negative regulator of flagellin synthesis FlgM